MKFAKKHLKEKYRKLLSCDKTLGSLYEILFSPDQLNCCEGNDGFRTYKYTNLDMKKKIDSAAAALYEKVGASHGYVAVEIDNSVEWIVAFWAILMSGNKPYLVNLRYPESLSNGILKRLNVEYTVCVKESKLETKSLLISELKSDKEPPRGIFEDELAFSSSATSMNEVVCFYKGEQVAEQLRDFYLITKLEPRLLATYKGELKPLAFLPFYHVFGLFAVYFLSAFYGGSLVFLRNLSSDTILKTCRRHNVTHIFAVPVLWHTVEKQVLDKVRGMGEKKFDKLMGALKFTTALQNLFPHTGSQIAMFLTRDVTDKLFGRSVRFCINGGSYVRDSALSLFNGLGYSLHNGYGMSEVGITSVELRKKAKHRNLNSIGMPFDSVKYTIDENGTLIISGSSICTRKLVNGVETFAGGDFSTGDKMTCRDGHYYIFGREGDVVIGENGENINPDMVEKLFSPKDAVALSVLGLDFENGQELSVVVQINPYLSAAKLEALKNEIYAVNDTLPKATALRRFFFTTDVLIPAGSIKASRTQVYKKIKGGVIKLVPFGEMVCETAEAESSAVSERIKEIVASTLNVSADRITAEAHLFNDLGATSIQYFSILTALSEEFAISEYNKTDKYCSTFSELCKYIERHL